MDKADNVEIIKFLKIKALKERHIPLMASPYETTQRLAPEVRLNTVMTKADCAMQDTIAVKETFPSIYFMKNKMPVNPKVAEKTWLNFPPRISFLPATISLQYINPPL